MRHRVSALGGHLRAEPSTPRGFTVLAELPVTEADDAMDDGVGAAS